MTDQNVSVVIPTVERTTVRAAVMSALNQTYQPLEVIVVVDKAEHSCPTVFQDMSDRIRVIFTGGIGPSGARMQGTLAAKGDIIAFLDDDDEWLPEKLERQLAAWTTSSNQSSHTVIASRYWVMDGSRAPLKTLPSRVLSNHDRIATYLFSRSSISYGEGVLHPSTIICDRALLDAEPWDPDLVLHEDWDWLLRIGERSDVDIRMCPEALAKVAAADKRSLSTTTDWRLSLQWLEQRANKLTARERGDFLMCHTAALALRSGTRRGGLIAASRALSSSRPGYKAWIVWVGHMISPRLVDHLSSIRSRRTPSFLKTTT